MFKWGIISTFPGTSLEQLPPEHAVNLQYIHVVLRMIGSEVGTQHICTISENCVKSDIATTLSWKISNISGST